MGLYSVQCAESAVQPPCGPTHFIPLTHSPCSFSLCVPIVCSPTVSVRQVQLGTVIIKVCVSLLLIFVLNPYRFDFAHFDKNYLLNLIRSPSQIFLFICKTILLKKVHAHTHNFPIAILLTPASFLVTIALILTLSVAAIDERIALYPNQPSLWSAAHLSA